MGHDGRRGICFKLHGNCYNTRYVANSPVVSVAALFPALTIHRDGEGFDLIVGLRHRINGELGPLVCGNVSTCGLFSAVDYQLAVGPRNRIVYRIGDQLKLGGNGNISVYRKFFGIRNVFTGT